MTEIKTDHWLERRQRGTDTWGVWGGRDLMWAPLDPRRLIEPHPVPVVHCKRCGDPVPGRRRVDAVYCSDHCQTQVHNERRREAAKRARLLRDGARCNRGHVLTEDTLVCNGIDPSSGRQRLRCSACLKQDRKGATG